METADANQERLGRDQALALARQVDRIIAAKGSKVVVIDLKKDRPGDQDLLAVMLGPTGNLRAPAIKKGRTLLVGFNADAYRANLA